MDVPVCHPPYQGNEDTYITYQLLGQTGQLCAEGAEQETGLNWAVSLWCRGSYAALLLSVRSLLSSAGYMTTVEGEYYDAEMRRSQVSVIATAVGEEYG